MKPLFVLLICACLFSCTTEARMEKLKQEMMDADRSFSELSKEKGMNHAFETYCAEDGVILRPENMPYVGKQTIKELLQKSDDTAIHLTWEPTDGKISRSGDLGFTYGIYAMELKDGSQSMQGTYVSVWVKEDGQWRFALDTGNDGL